MDAKATASDQDMTEIRSKVALAAAEAQVLPTRTTSIDGSNKRIVPKGPKDLPGAPSQEARQEPQAKVTSKDDHFNSSPRITPSSTQAASLDRRTRPGRSSSVDGSVVGSNKPTLSEDDGFLVIQRPPPIHPKAEAATSAGATDSVKEPSQSIISKITGSRRSEPKPWPPEAIAELQRREEIFHQMKVYIDKLEERIQSQDHEIVALNTALADTEHKLDLTRQDLNASRAFVSSEGTGDAQHLIKSLRELNSSIDDFAFRLMQEVLPEAATSRVVSKEGLEAMCKAQPSSGRLLSFITTAFKVNATIGDFAHPFICHSLCARLNELVFGPFVPGLDRETSQIFQKIYELVHQNEPQERSARWRAITYAHADTQRNDKFFCEKAGDDFLLRMMTALNPLIAPETITFEKLKSELGEVIIAVFTDAVKLQDRAKTGYMSFDYGPFMTQIDVPFHPVYMSTAEACADVRQGGKGKASNAILVVGLGMQAWKSVVKEDKTHGRDTNIAVKATVICGNWNPSA